MYDHDIEDVIEEYGLPELPEPADDPDDGPATLVLSRFGQENIWLGDCFTVADAQEYCSDEDTHGDGWFVFYRVQHTPEEQAASLERDTALLGAARKIDRLLGGSS